MNKTGNLTPIVDRMKVAAVVILYNPDNSHLANLRTYSSYFENIFVFDNTEDKALPEGIFYDRPGISYHHDGYNEGIAKRLNQAATSAIQGGFEWLFTLDQDTVISPQTLTNYLNCFAPFNDKDKVAAFGPKYNRDENKNGYECDPQKIDGLITSGMLLNLRSFQAIGPFDEALFIDGVDHEFCIRSRLAGYSIIQFANIDILHELGKQVLRSSFKTLYLVKKRKVVHPPLRCYYIYRNMLYLQQKYQSADPAFLDFISKHAMSRIKTSAFYGGNFWKTVRYLIRARRDFKNHQMGKIKE